MSYNFDMYGRFKFNKILPEEAKKILLVLKQENIDSNYDMSSDDLRKILNNKNIDACWCPWEYNEDENSLNTVDDIDELAHNYYFIDWIGWFIESICIPNNIQLNGTCKWFGDCVDHTIYTHGKNGNGQLTVTNNKMNIIGKFFGSDGWKKTVKRVNKLVEDNQKQYKTPEGEIKGSFCVTGKVSITRPEFQKLGVKYGYEFKSSVTKDLTYLVCNNPNSTSSKIKNAKKNGIKVVTEEEFNKILGVK